MKKILLLAFFFTSTLIFSQTGVYSVGSARVLKNGIEPDNWTEGGTVSIQEKEGNKVLIEIRYGDYLNDFIAEVEYHNKKKQYLYFAKNNYLTIRQDYPTEDKVIYFENTDETKNRTKIIFKILK